MSRHSNLAPDSLGFAMCHAADVLVRVRGGHSLTEALRTVLEKIDSAQARGAVQDLAYRAMRGRGRADFIVQQLAKRVPQPEFLRELCTLALCLIDPHVSDPLPYSSFTVVDQAVRAVASNAGTVRAKGFINAILRQALRERDALDRVSAKDPLALWNYPKWWIDRVMVAYPQQWQQILKAGNTPAPLTLRVNRRRSTVSEYLEMLCAHGVIAAALGGDAVRLESAMPVSRIPGFVQGVVSVQDEAAQRAAPLLDVREGQRVLDACAAPGGKTGHLLEIAAIELDALDQDPVRLVKVGENLARLGLSARLLCANAVQPQDWWDGNLYDRILADVPCTASGIVRRHPDIRWLRRDADVVSLSRQQQQILDALWRLLRPGGKLLLVTCSIFPQEGQEQASEFAFRHPDALVLDTPGQLVPVASPGVDHDGLFFALFEKRA